MHFVERMKLTRSCRCQHPDPGPMHLRKRHQTRMKQVGGFLLNHRHLRIEDQSGNGPDGGQGRLLPHSPGRSQPSLWLSQHRGCGQRRLLPSAHQQSGGHAPSGQNRRIQGSIGYAIPRSTLPITNRLMSCELEKAEQKLPLERQGMIFASQETGNQGIKSKRNFLNCRPVFHPFCDRVLLRAQFVRNLP